MKKHKVYIFVLVIVLIFSAILYYTFLFRNKIAYIDNVVIYSEFNMTKEFDKKALQAKTLRQNVLDSMQFSLSKLSKLIENKTAKKQDDIIYYEGMLKDYYKKKQQFEEDNNSMVNDFNQQIWSQLNQYIKDFGEKNEYDIIYGASGDGNIMYAKKSYDISKEISEYVNYRYGGGSK